VTRFLLLTIFFWLLSRAIGRALRGGSSAQARPLRPPPGPSVSEPAPCSVEQLMRCERCGVYFPAGTGPVRGRALCSSACAEARPS
jgi:hypothetical protein